MKIFKKIRLWLIKKLNAVPRETKEIAITHYTAPVAEVYEYTTIHPRTKIAETMEYQDYVKKSIATQIGLDLLEKGLIEFEFVENPMEFNKKIYGRVRVARPPSEVTAESAISAFQKAAQNIENMNPDDYTGLQINPTMIETRR